MPQPKTGKTLYLILFALLSVSETHIVIYLYIIQVTGTDNKDTTWRQMLKTTLCKQKGCATQTHVVRWGYSRSTPQTPSKGHTLLPCSMVCNRSWHFPRNPYTIGPNGPKLSTGPVSLECMTKTLWNLATK